MMVEAEDNEAVARLSLEIGVQVGLHIETLPALAIWVAGEQALGHLEGGGEFARRTDEPPDQWQVPGRTS